MGPVYGRRFPGELHIGDPIVRLDSLRGRCVGDRVILESGGHHIDRTDDARRALRVE